MDKKILGNSFLFGGNGLFIEELYERFLYDPSSVDKKWQEYFSELAESPQDAESYIKRGSWAPKKKSVIGVEEKGLKTESSDISYDNAYFNAQLLIEGYRLNGHLLARLDPLDLEKMATAKDLRLEPKNFGFTEENFDKKIAIPKNSLDIKDNTVRELISSLRKAYCSTIGFEFAHIPSVEQKDWLFDNAESISKLKLANESLKTALEDLIEIEGFEQFIHTKFPGAKRFSVEGGDSSIIALKQIIQTACEESPVEEVIIGMPHRGRLNVLTKIMGKNYEELLSEFQGNLAHREDLHISGDVKYHLGRSSQITVKDDKKVHLSLTSNPSHLEAVNSVVQGKVRAKQDALNDSERSKVLGILLHGDAAFSGQGVVAESLSIGDLEGYCTGGTMHIIVNNQIGFTTTPKEARLSRYPTEFAKIIQAPVIHVNGDDPESVIKVSMMAERFRQKFKKDIIIDIICYRRFGHNEGDEPMFTQPIMYNKIKSKETTAALFAKKLTAERVVTQDEYAAKVNIFYNQLDKEYAASKFYVSDKADWLEGKWSKMSKYEKNNIEIEKTGISTKDIKKITKALISCPESFNLNSKVKRLFDNKKKMFDSGKDFDWATAEALAFASLLLEGKKVRLTGQDSKRGTFSHRHAVLFDQHSEQEYIPLNNISHDQAKIEIHNSNLSEFAVLGFEYGYSVVDPNCLTIWEAQFGDFSNSCQVIIDQFISSSEHKWLRMSGLVMLLPHGYEGQGPEHSSARLERYLQLCAEHNMQVINCTTPANYFHAIRRQIIDRNFRKPLVVMSPKSLLRHKLVVSDIEEMAENTTFNKIFDDNKINIKKVKRIVLCSGKVYYDLLEARDNNKINDVALIRIEQYYPFPRLELEEILAKYNKDCEFVWCQEEPKNMGAWNFLCHYIDDILENIGCKLPRVKYVGRKKASSPAAGYLKMHLKQQELLVNEALNKK